jgi:flagellar hook-associated protein 2
MASVDGLISGMSTSDVIAQLMQAEAAPQNQLKTKITTENKVITAYQAVNTKVSALQTAAEALTKYDTWKGAKATSSSTSVAANAAAGAQAGAITFNVKTLAKAHVITSVLDEANPLTTNGTLTLTGAGLEDPLDITVDDDTPDGVAAAINAAAEAAGATVRAAVVTTDGGKVLQVTSTKTGKAGEFDIAGLTTAPKLASQGTDAQIEVGDLTKGGYTVSSATNTFTGVLPGVTFTASKQENDVTITAAPDSASLADKMQAMVDAANGALSEITKNASYNTTSNTGGPLTSDFTVRTLQSKLLSNVSGGASDYGSFKQLGIQLDRNGKLSFDRSAFLAAYDTNPSTVKTAVSEGLAASLNDTAKAATNSTTGNLTVAIQAGNNQVKDLTTRVSDWDRRLADKKAQLTKQFANLEVSLGKLKSQSSWLAGQISSLSS